MRTKLIALALAAMLAVGAGGVVAAGASSGDASGEQLPDDYTVEITDPFDELSSDEVDEAIETAWSDEQVQSSLDAGDGVHFDVVAGTEKVQVAVAPGSDAEDQVVAKIDSDGTVTDVFEPSLTAEDSETLDTAEPVDASGDGTIRVEVEDHEYDEKLSADQAMRVEVKNMSLLEDGESVSVEVADE
ncbi:hypothetical protein [Halorubrum sp. Hd13]|uniref:hypothetical protein n=1 Tax=Halorubrum sp. Hd13 TaxID=1480728 RepID=UPI000B996C7E|nr:hypothetical protein [Halorubrum sp. Hd13]OYR38766.1 hypothetical protein DJ81_17235 [Halorubrum sp. Hd13]